jgi:hypothetical protein
MTTRIVSLLFVALITTACGESPTSSSSLTGTLAGGDASFATRAIGDDVPSKPPVPGSPRLSNDQCTPSPVVVAGSVGSVVSVVGMRAHMSVKANPNADTYMGEARISRRLPDGTWSAPVNFKSRDMFTRNGGSDTAVYEVEVPLQDYEQRIDMRVRVLWSDCQSNWSDWTTVLIATTPGAPAAAPVPVPPVSPTPPVVPPAHAPVPPVVPPPHAHAAHP